MNANRPIEQSSVAGHTAWRGLLLSGAAAAILVTGAVGGRFAVSIADHQRAPSLSGVDRHVEDASAPMAEGPLDRSGGAVKRAESDHAITIRPSHRGRVKFGGR